MAEVTSVIREDARLIVSEMAGVLEPLAGATLLITGAGGFLCGYILDVVAAFNEQARSQPCRVIALDNYITGVPDRIAHLANVPDFDLVKYDVVRPFEPAEPVQWIIHGAGIASPTFYRRYPLETVDVNVTGTRHMLDLAARFKVKAVLYTSTSEIYGDPDPAHTPTSEDYRGNVSCTGPRACYDESKRLAETLCAIYHQREGVPVKVVRPFNVYGPGQRLDDKRIIPDMMSAALKRDALVLLSDGRATRSFCYIRDFIRGLLYVMIMGGPGEAYNVGNDEEVSIGHVADLVAELAGPPKLKVEYRVSSDPHYLTDNPQRRCPTLTKVRSATPYLPQVMVREGLSRTLRSYKES